MTLRAWQERWQQGRIGFHRSEIHPTLQRFSDELLGASNARVLVPLCGKSVDLVWLASRCRFPLVGVEFVESAVQAFFQEQAIDATRQPHPRGWPIYRGGEMELHAGDAFEVIPELGLFDGIYDRAALIALPPERRSAYASLLRGALAPGGRLLLLTVSYDQRQMSGPPYAVPDDEVHQHFARPGFSIERVEDEDIFDPQGNFAQRGLTWQRHAAYLVRHR